MGEVKLMTAHQTLLLEMLKDFDAVCRKHHIYISSSPERRWAPFVTTASSRGTTTWM